MSNSKDDDNEEIWKERCHNCIRCSEKNDCQQCSACKNRKTCETRRCFSAKKLYTEKVKRMADENYRQIMAKTAAREAETAKSEPAAGEPEKKKRGRKKGSTAAAAKKISERDYVPSRPTRQQSADNRRKRTQINLQPDKIPRQCLYPECIYEARSDSKYCSDECGKMLAKLRLTEILPVRCKEYFAGPRSSEEDIQQKRTLINRDMQDLTNAEKHMIRFLEKLHEYVEKQSRFAPEVAEDRDDDNMYEACIVCGQPDVPLRKYAKHIDLCWSRSEKVISFGAPEKNNDNFYCEELDRRTNTYCKRLKSLCPEHKRPGPEHCLRICGYPKRWEDSTGGNVKTLSEVIESEDPFGDEGCMTKKDLCSKHHKWLPSLRGSIELEQACLFQKMFELCHETHKMNTQAEWSTNALSILMHKAPKVVDQAEFSAFLKSMRSENPADADPEMSETAKVLVSLKVQERGEKSTNTCSNANALNTPLPSLSSPTPTSKSNFSVARLLE